MPMNGFMYIPILNVFIYTLNKNFNIYLCMSKLRVYMLNCYPLTPDTLVYLHQGIQSDDCIHAINLLTSGLLTANVSLACT